MRKKKVLARLEGTQKALSVRFSDFLHNLESELLQEYNKILHQEEIFWYQKSRVKWLVDGERNTKFFHKSTLMRRRRNKILMLQIGEDWIKSDEILRTHAREYFARLFTESDQTRQRSNGRRIHLKDLMELLEKQVDLKELKDVVWATHPFKAPEPDGLQSIFYQNG